MAASRRPRPGPALGDRARAWLRRALVVTCAVAATSCLSPTLPLPPPSEPETIQPAEEEGLWEIRGDCTPGALVTVFNTRTGRGVVYEDRNNRGTYRIEIAATRCDLAWVTEEVDTELSTQTSFVIQERANSLAVDPSACQ